MSKEPLVVDTMVLLGMLSNSSSYADLLQKIKQTCNRIVVSTQIVKEWIHKSHVEGMTPMVLLIKLNELTQVGKIKKCNKTEIEISRRLISRENCRKPNDRYDMKFLEVALATEATLITQDSGLLNLSPYKCGRKNVRIVTPADYLNETICS